MQFMKFKLFVFQLNSLLEKNMLQLTDKIYFIDNNYHYELERVDDCYIITCIEKDEVERYYTDEIYKVDTDEYLDESEDDEISDYAGFM